MERITLSSSLGKLLDWCRTQSATDLHAQADRRYSYRVDGKLERISPEQFLNLLTGIIEASVSEGMHSFDQHLMQHLRQGLVSEETARYYAVNWNRLDMEMHGYVSSASGILKPDAKQ